MTILKIEKTRQPSIIGRANRARFFRNYIKKNTSQFAWPTLPFERVTVVQSLTLLFKNNNYTLTG
jgi:hypothetical protein